MYSDIANGAFISDDGKYWIVFLPPSEIANIQQGKAVKRVDEYAAEKLLKQILNASVEASALRDDPEASKKAGLHHFQTFYREFAIVKYFAGGRYAGENECEMKVDKVISLTLLLLFQRLQTRLEKR